MTKISGKLQVIDFYNDPSFRMGFVMPAGGLSALPQAVAQLSARSAAQAVIAGSGSFWGRLGIFGVATAATQMGSDTAAEASFLKRLQAAVEEWVTTSGGPIILPSTTGGVPWPSPGFPIDPIPEPRSPNKTGPSKAPDTLIPEPDKGPPTSPAAPLPRHNAPNMTELPSIMTPVASVDQDQVDSEVEERLRRASEEIAQALDAVPRPPELRGSGAGGSRQMDDAEFHAYTTALRRAWREILGIFTQLRSEGIKDPQILDRLTDPYKGTIFETNLFDLQRRNIPLEEDHAPDQAARHTMQFFDATQIELLPTEVLALLESLLVSAFRVIRYEDQLRRPEASSTQRRGTFDGIGLETLQVDIMLIVLEAVGAQGVVDDLLKLGAGYSPAQKALDVVRTELQDLRREGKRLERNIAEIRQAREAQRHLQDAQTLRDKGEWFGVADHYRQAADVLEELGIPQIPQILRDEARMMDGIYVKGEDPVESQEWPWFGSRHRPQPPPTPPSPLRLILDPERKPK